VNKNTVGVLGGGQWGVALAHAAHVAGNDVLLCTRREPSTPLAGVSVTPELAQLGARTTLILMAVPSDVARSVAAGLGDVVDGRHMVVHAVRGLSGEGLLTLSAVVRQETPVRRVGALGGPVLADELLTGHPGVIAVASHYPEVLAAVQRALGSSLLRVSETTDLMGLEWASALVGALLVGAGYARAVGVSGGLLAGLMTRAMHEAAQIGVAAGAEQQTFFGVPGFGDLMAAMEQQEARPEVRFGHALADGLSAAHARQKVGARIEAIDLVPRVVTFAREHGLHVPVFDALEAVIAGRANKATVLPALMIPSHHKR
jgi:glycerol-3-phosphate dehydrogenase (NAD(P)+)